MIITDELLEGLLSPDASRRQAAEAHYAALEVHARIEGLTRLLETRRTPNVGSSSRCCTSRNISTTTQHLAAVLLRRDILQLTQTSELQALATRLLSLVAVVGSTIKGINDCLAQVTASLQILDLPAAVDMVTVVLQNQPTNRGLWTVIAESAPQAFYQSNAWTCVSPLVQDGDIESLALVVATLRATPEAAQQQQLVLPHNLSTNDPRVLDLIGQAADSSPRMLQGRMDLLPIDTLPGVQLLVQLLSHDGAVSDFGSLIPTAMATCWTDLVKMSSAKDDDDDDDVDNDDSHAQALMSALVRYPGALPWLWPVLEQSIQPSQQQQQQLCLAAILALGAAWDGAPRASMEHVQTAAAVALAAPLCRTSIRLLGLIVAYATAQDLLPDYPLAIVKRLMDACAQSRTARWACDALSTLAQGALLFGEQHSERVSSYLPGVLNALACGPMSSSSNDLKVQALGTVACWATAAGEHFGPFYSQWVPTLLQMISAGGLDEALFSACLETATVIGQAVPKAFWPDAQHILQSISFDDATQQPCCVFVACARIASVMQEAYTPFLDLIIPRLLCRLNDRSSDLEFAEGDWQSSLGEVVDDSITVALPGHGLTKVTINTSKIQEKAQLARAVYEHVVAVGSSYGPYCSASLEAFLPLVEYQYSADVRGTAAQTVAALFEAACMSGEETNSMAIPKAFLSRTLDILSRQLENEDVSDMEVYYSVADALSDTARMMYLYGGLANGDDLLGVVEENEVAKFVSRVMQYLSACLLRRSELTTKRPSVNGVDLLQEIDDALRKEEDLLIPLVDSVGWLLKTYKENFVGIFERLVIPVLGGYLHSGNDVRATLSSVCLFDDCIEFCGPSATSKYAPMLLQGVLLGLSDVDDYRSDDDLRRASIYGVAQMARYAPSSVMEPHARWIVQELSQIIGNSELHGGALDENAVSALASLVLFRNAPFARAGFLKRDLVLQQFISALPLTIDEDEAKICHAGLCDLVENGELIDLLLLSSKAYAILSKVHDGDELATPATCDRLKAVIQYCNQGQGSYDGLSRAANIVSP